MKRILSAHWDHNDKAQKIYIFYFLNKMSTSRPTDSYVQALHLPSRAYTLKTSKERGYLTFATALIVKL
jgi:hypothetical protein